MLPRRYLPSLPSLLALEAVDRLGSASAAAEELNLTQGAISRQLQVMADQLQVQLTTRDQGRLALTPAARDYVVQVRQTLTTLAQASLTLRANPTGGALNLAILPAFGMYWLAPRLATFAKLHPEITVNLSTRLKPFDFATTGFDAAIHYGRADWPGTEHLKLMDEDVLAVAAPSLTPPLSHPAEALKLPLLHLQSRPGDWGRWLAAHDAPKPPPQAMQFDQFATMQQAAIHGLGAAILPLFLIEADLASNRLIPLYGPALRSQSTYSLVWPSHQPRPPLAAFIAWLKTELA